MRSLSAGLAAVALGSAMSAHGMAADVPAVNPLLVEPVERLRPDEVRFMQQRLADWPELQRYRDANARLPAAVPGQPRVVLFGDSITEGWGREGSATFFPGKGWLNRGISGQTTAQMLVRFPQDVLALKPRVVVILAGTNDIAGNTGPAHLAAAVGTPVVSLFAPTVPASRWAPYGVPHVLLGDPEAPCAGSRARVCPVAGHPCLSSVTPGEVVRAVIRLVKEAA